VKSHRAKGKRITTFEVAELRFVEPVRENPEDADAEEGEPDEITADVEDIDLENGTDIAEGEGSPEINPAPEEIVELSVEKPEIPVKKEKEPAVPKNEEAVLSEIPVAAPVEEAVVQPVEIEFTIERAEEEKESRNPNTTQLGLF